MEWVPIVLVTFKVAVFGWGMFYAIKWHHDRGQEEKRKKEAAAAAAASAAAAEPTPPGPSH